MTSDQLHRTGQDNGGREKGQSAPKAQLTAALGQVG